MPQVSILMPVYNGEAYLREAIDSILQQTFTDFECVIINDGSTDSTRQIVLSYHDSRIRFFENTENIGLTRSLIKGLPLLQGEYIARMDADDIYLPDKLARQVAFMKQHPTIGIVGTAWVLIDETGKEYERHHVAEGLHFVHFMCNGSALIRRTCFTAVGGYREIFRYAQDYDLFLRFAEHCRIANLQEVLYKLRTHKHAISIRQFDDQMLYCVLALILTEERKARGHDSLMGKSCQEAIPIRDMVFQASPLKKRYYFSRMNATFGQAAYTLHQYGKAVNYCRVALKYFPCNLRALRILGRIFMTMGWQFFTETIKKS